jgi:nucleotide-binding universal stress UspA family protein
MAAERQNGGPTIVVGYDGSPTSRAAVGYASRRAGADGRVFVVHAYGPPPDWLGSPYYQRVLEDHESRGRALLDALAMGDDPLLETNFEIELLDGSPAEAIERVADTRHADEIVVGSRGLGRLRSTLGSVSHELLHTAHVPVVVIPRAADGES